VKPYRREPMKSLLDKISRTTVKSRDNVQPNRAVTLA